MDSGADKNAPAGDGQQDDNIVNEQPIEISSDSSNGARSVGEDEEEVFESGSERDLDSDSDISIINSVSDSSESHNDERLEDEFQTILSMPFKEYKLYMQLCHTAFKLNVFEKIDVAISEFEKYATIPSHIWLRYLKTLQVVTQTPQEHEVFQSKCRLALSSYYDDQLAEFIVKSLEQQPLVDHGEMWAKLLADYGLERVDFIEKSRALLRGITDKAQAEQMEQMLSSQCVNWNCNEEQLQEMQQLINEFKQKLKNSTENTSYLQEMFILRIDTLTLDRNIKITLAKIIYERCLTKYPSDSGLWLDYLAYMQKPLQSPNTDGDNASKNGQYMQVHDGYLKSRPLELIKRALQSKPSVQLNHKYLQLMELQQLSLEQIDDELRSHFNRIERYMEMTVELQLDYLAYRVRHTNVEDEQQVDALRAAFRRVWDRLSEQYGDLADTGYEVLQLWALVEYAQLKSPSNGADIWSEIFSYPGSSDKSHLWLAYAQMEGEYNAGLKIRTVLQQALMSLPANAEGISHLYRRYERCFGNCDTIADCQAYCQQIQESNLMPGGRPQRGTTYAQGRRQQTQFQDKPGRKHLPTGPAKNPFRPVKKELPAAKKPIPPAKKNVQKKKPAADESKAPNFKYAPHLEANKIFIKNLYAQCSKEDLTQAFQAFGTIKDIRLVYRHNQKFKGIAYIEFEQPDQALKAVAGGDGLDIGGQAIVVAISNPPVKGAAGSASTAAAGTGAGAGSGSGSGSGLMARKAEKRRFPTSLIPTKLVMLDMKRRRKLELDEDATDANGKSTDANGNANANETANEAAATTAPKSNDDFRKLFNI
ncbi:RNA-binding protein 4F [Drosophila innubila]|uniref:RNA-binding protein 4F n=1 Tax=Drosophila innubila TaxID=198719 RepID=UPI00148CA055|nr:RNA-binding protein 4F [Drosophila innubila]